MFKVTYCRIVEMAYIQLQGDGILPPSPQLKETAAMNAARRKEIIKAINMLADARQMIGTAADEERDYFDAMPESLQGGERGQRADEVADLLTDLADRILEIEGEIEDAAA